MTLDDARSQWQNSNRELLTPTEREELIARVCRRAEKFGSEIFRRDAIETIVGLVLSVVFGMMFIAFDMPLAKVGSGMAVVSILYIIFRLHRTRTCVRPPRPDASVRDFCGAEIERLDRQIQQSRSILWWYIAPCLFSANLVFFGLAGFGWVSAGYFLFTILFGWGVYWLNQYAVRKSMLPVRDELSALLNDLSGVESMQ